MKINKSYIILIFLAFSYYNMDAREIHDVINNKTLETQLFSKEVDSKYSNYKTKIEVDYIQIADAQSNSFLKFNTSSYDLCMSYLDQEGKAIILNREINERINIYNKLKYSSIDKDYPNRNRGGQSPPKLKEIESDIVSLLGNILFIEVKFLYEIPAGGNRYNRNQEFTLRHYYTYDLSSSKMKLWESKMSRSQLDHIQKQIAAQLNTEYLLATAKLDRSDISLLESYEDEDEIKEPSCKDICTKIDLQDADFIWYAWGVLIQFQEFTQSSAVYYGTSFNVFIPLNEAKEIFKGIPQFDFLQTIVVKNNQLKNFNLQEFQINLSSSSSSLEMHDILKVIPEAKAKTLVINRYQKSVKNQSKDFRGRSVIEFNTYGNTMSRSNFQENDQLGNVDYYSYDSLGNRTQHIRQNSRKEEESNTYTYDENYNLTSITRMSKSEFGKELFFYNGSYIYRVSISTIGQNRYNRNNDVQRYYLKGNEFGSNDNNYILNKDQKVVGNTAKKYIGNLFQVGYDSLGRKVESHRDRDRYHTYWSYDRMGRLSSYSSYEYEKPRSEVLYSYEGESMLPTNRITTNTSGGNTSIIVEEYTWAYFE